MCTSIAFPERELYGRNLDLEYHFGEKVVVTPRSHAFAFRHIEPLERHYAMIGMASVAEDKMCIRDRVVRQHARPVFIKVQPVRHRLRYERTVSRGYLPVQRRERVARREGLRCV